MDIMSIITAALGLAQTIAPLVTDSTQVQSIINTVEKVTDQIGPAIKAGVNFIEDITPTIAATFEVLRNSGATTPEQLAQMDAIETKLDADYDTASAAAKAEDDAADAAAAKPTT
jgi:uncharacterized protein YqgV (UPF0045/DUF77 family)